MEIYLDTAQGKNYASRNHNDYEQVWKTDNKTERFQVDWMFTMRQAVPKLRKSKFSASVPEFHTVREKSYGTTPPEDGPYRSKYAHFGKSEALPEETGSTKTYD